MDLKQITVQEFNYANAGNIDCKAIQENFDELLNTLNNVVNEINTIKDVRESFMRTILIETTTPVTILEGGNHANLKIVSGFIMAADNLKMDQQINIVNSKEQSLVEPKTLKATEKSGKAQSFEVIGWRTIGKFDDVIVVPSSVRKTLISILLEEI